MKNTKELKTLLAVLFYLNRLGPDDKDIRNVLNYTFNRVFDQNTNMLLLACIGRTKADSIDELTQLLKTDTKFFDYLKDGKLTAERPKVYMVRVDWMFDENAFSETHLFSRRKDAVAFFNKTIDEQHKLPFLEDEYENGEWKSPYVLDSCTTDDGESDLYWNLTNKIDYGTFVNIELTKIKIE